jgi:uncharacterized membrane protein
MLTPDEVESPPPDPIGFALAWSVLTGMVAAFSYAAWRVAAAWQHLFKLGRASVPYAKTWAIPLLALVGLGVAAYLAYVEITHVEAVCGPVGECNLVQASPYTQILSIPIAVLGMLNYMAIGALWGEQRYAVMGLANLAGLGLWALTLGGALFSIYLTLLEIFAIGAICAWCLSSAVITTVLMLLVIVPLPGMSVRHQYI